MVYLKTEEEIALMKESNLLVSKTLAEIAGMMKPGTKTIDIDKVAEEFIRSHGAVPGFLNYNGFPNSLCISVNEKVVHGIPSSYELKEGDIVSVDCGVYKNKYHGDSAYTFPIGNISEDVSKLLEVTKESLYLGINAAVEGKRIGDIGFTIQNHAESNGFSVVREMVGHGIGRNLHESPEVPNYGRRGRGMKLQKGLVIAIEPMINMGTKFIKQSKDGWTISTVDGKPSAHYEHTIAIDKNKAIILSDFNIIEEAFKKLN